MIAHRPRLLREMLAPIALAGYAAWTSVWLATGSTIAIDQPLGWTVRTALVTFLVLLLAERWVRDRIGLPGFIAIATALAGLALWIIAVTPYGVAPILLVLLAGVLASQLEWRRLLPVLALLNIAFAAVVLSQWQGRSNWPWVHILAFASFQMFAAMVMRYAVRAEAMAERLRAVNTDLIATRSLLAESARDSERLRLSRDLHDTAGYALTALKLNLGVLGRDPAQPDPERIRLCSRLADELLRHLRAVVSQTRAGDGIDLRQAIERLAAPLPRPALALDIEPELQLAGLDRIEALLRVVQEGLTNAARHSGADRAWLRLCRHQDRIELELRDDGRAPARIKPGHGLTGMHERLRDVGGDLTIGTGPEGGVRLHAWIPASAR